MTVAPERPVPSDERRCVLCGGPPRLTWMGRPFFGGNVPEGPLHHDDQPDQLVDMRFDGAPVVVSCYRAWTVYGRRPS